MKKIIGIAVLLFSPLIGSGDTAYAADKTTQKLYEVYNSTAVPVNRKPRLKHVIDRREQIERIHGSGRAATRRTLFAPVSGKTADISSVSSLAVGTEFKLGEVYCYPNPAKKANPTFHIETGLADKVELKIYDVSGDLKHDAALAGSPHPIDDGQGPQLAYEYLWDTKNVGSGVYIFSITSSLGDKTLKKTGRCAVIK